MASESKQIKVGVILSYAQLILNVVIGLTYTPIMIRLLGPSEYGLYHMVSSVISLLSILSLGFNSGYIRYYAKYKKENNVEAINKLNGLFMIVFTVIGLIALLCGLFLTFNLKLVFDTGLTASELSKAKILMLLLTANLALSFPFSVFSSIISAHEKFIFLKLLSMLRTVLSPLITLPLLLLGYGSVALVIINVSITLAVDLVFLFYTRIVLNQKFVFRDFEKGILKSLFIYTSFIAINLIIDQINWNIDKFLLGRYLGTTAVAVYSIGYTLFNHYMVISTAISNVFTPRLHNLINQTNDDIVLQRERLTQLFTKVGRIQFLILALLASGMLFFGKPFIYLWAGEGYEDAYYIMIILVLSSIIPLIQNLGIEIQRAQNNHKFRSIIYSIMAVLNLIASIILIQKVGVIGSAIGTGVSLVFANGFIINIYYAKKCNIDVLFFWKNILRLMLGLIIPVAAGVLLVLYIDLYVFWKFIVCVVGYTLVYCLSVWLIGMNNYEKQLIKRFFAKLKRRQ